MHTVRVLADDSHTSHRPKAAKSFTPPPLSCHPLVEQSTPKAAVYGQTVCVYVCKRGREREREDLMEHYELTDIWRPKCNNILYLNDQELQIQSVFLDLSVFSPVASRLGKDRTVRKTFVRTGTEHQILI